MILCFLPVIGTKRLARVAWRELLLLPRFSAVEGTVSGGWGSGCADEAGDSGGCQATRAGVAMATREAGCLGK